MRVGSEDSQSFGFRAPNLSRGIRRKKGSGGGSFPRPCHAIVHYSEGAGIISEQYIE